MYRSNAKNFDDFVSSISRQRRSTHCILKETDYAIHIQSGLAAVEMRRTFVNAESKAIEALLTFPVPYEAVVTGLAADIDGRRLVAQAQLKKNARETYEGAIDEGKSAVLHEELLKGLHMVSVANVRPQAKIVVTTNFVVPVSMIGQDGRVRIPLTVGQIYGELPLQETDKISANGPEQFASVHIHCPGPANLNGKHTSGVDRVSLGTSMDILLPKHSMEMMRAKAKDGRQVSLTFSQVPDRKSAMHFDLLLDASGSMAEPDSSGRSKWDVMISSLTNAEALGLHPEDQVTLWVFSTNIRNEGTFKPSDLPAAVKRASFDKGATEMDKAIEVVSRSRKDANILIVTDGRAALANKAVLADLGSRITAVLMGGDALEANISYLASSTGGQTFVCFGQNTERDIASAINSMQFLQPIGPVSKERPQAVSRAIGGTLVVAKWESDKRSFEDATGVSAFAASLALTSMSEEQAAEYAVEEGIVTNMTSLVLVDEAGAAIEGLPSQRKVDLAAPRIYTTHQASYVGSMLRSAPPQRALFATAAESFVQPVVAAVSAIANKAAGEIWRKPSSKPVTVNNEQEDWGAILKDALQEVAAQEVSVPATWDIHRSLSANPIMWDDLIDKVLKVDLVSLPLAVRARVSVVSSNAAVIALASRCGVSVEALAIGILAYCSKEQSRTADRIQRKLLAGIEPGEIESVLTFL